MRGNTTAIIQSTLKIKPLQMGDKDHVIARKLEALTWQSPRNTVERVFHFSFMSFRESEATQDP